jgi:hypothetical protein
MNEHIETGLMIPEKCMKCELTLETIDGCKDCLRIKAGLPYQKTFEEYKSWLKEQIQKNKEQVFEKKTEDWIPVVRVSTLSSLLDEKQ